MIINKNPIPESSFLSVEKDMNLIVDRILKNNRLTKLLYYTSQDALDKPKLTDEQKISLFGKQIKTVPKILIDRDVQTYLVIKFISFATNETNPEFRDNIIEFDIVCHADQWILKDFQLRPFKIAAEIDSMFNESRLTGIGKLEFDGAEQLLETDEYSGLCLTYKTYHGDEDKKPMPNPREQAQFEEDFFEMMDLND